MNFWNKRINSDEYEKLSKKLVDLESTVTKLETAFKILETNYNNLRGMFNRKLSGLKKEEQVEETENINSPVILPHNGFNKFSLS